MRRQEKRTWKLFQPRNPSKGPTQKRTSLHFFSFLSQRRHFRRERERETTALFYAPRCLCGEPKRKSVRVEIFVVSFAMRANIVRDITFTLSLKIYASSSSSSREISDEQKRLERRGVCFSPLLSPGASGVGFQVDALFFSVSFVERVRSRFGFIFRSPSV